MSCHITYMYMYVYMQCWWLEFHYIHCTIMLKLVLVLNCSHDCASVWVDYSIVYIALSVLFFNRLQDDCCKGFFDKTFWLITFLLLVVGTCNIFLKIYNIIVEKTTALDFWNFSYKKRFWWKTGVFTRKVAKQWHFDFLFCTSSPPSNPYTSAPPVE